MDSEPPTPSFPSLDQGLNTNMNYKASNAKESLTGRGWGKLCWVPAQGLGISQIT